MLRENNFHHWNFNVSLKKTSSVSPPRGVSACGINSGSRMESLPDLYSLAMLCHVYRMNSKKISGSRSIQLR